MNPMLRTMRPAMNLMSQVKQLQDNPKGVYDLLANSGRLTSEQLKAIKGMSNPMEIGQYLLQSAPQNMLGSIQQNVNNLYSQK